MNGAKCKSCGRPMPAGRVGRCDACEADRKALWGKVLAGAGAVLSVVAGIFLKGRGGRT